MNKPHLLLFLVTGEVEEKDEAICDECLEQFYESETMSVMFSYYDYKESNNTDFYLHLCKKCFKSKIEDKPLKSLLNYIPLMKLKRRGVDSDIYDYNPVIGYLHRFEEEEYEYFKEASDKDVEDFKKRGREYNKS